MADTGAPHLLPYPTAADVPNGPAQLQALAAQVAARLGPEAAASVATNQSTASAGPLDLTTTGPTVTIVLASASLVAVYATAKLESSGSGVMRVYLEIDATNAGQILEGVAGAGNTNYKATDPGSTTGLTDNSLGGTGVGLGGGFLVRPYAAGSHTFKLRYGSTGGTVFAAERNLWVRTFVT